AVAARIAELLREEDTVARLGGDEFVVLLPHLSAPGDAIAVAQRLLAAFEGHFDAGTYAVRVTPSIGVAVYPDDAADASALLTALGERVLELACEQAQIWSTAGMPGLPLAVNLSPRQFVGSPLAALVASALRRHQLPGSALELEVTETAALDHLELT